MKKTVIITGGSTGIGKSTANIFLQNDYKVFVLDIAQPDYSDENMSYLQCDVADVKSINNAIKDIVSKTEHIDALVSNAGVHLSANIENTTEEDYQRVVDINLKGSFFTLKAVIPHMRKQGKGAVVLVGSDQCFIGKPNSAIYGATKAAIGQLAKSTAIDYAKHGIRVNCVCAGTIDTPLYQKAIRNHSERSGITLNVIEEDEAAQQLLERVGKPEEVAELIYFLCGDNAGFITGGLFPIDGGYTAG